jgi:hypothetical protein
MQRTKKTMKTRCLMFAFIAAGCAMAVALPPRAVAQVSEEDFKALKQAVQELSNKVQKLEQTHVSDEQTHQKDMEDLQRLKDKLAETQRTADDAEQKSAAAAAAQAQPMQRVPIDEATVNHNFLVLGDAEFQYAKAAGQHGAFALADFAPIFLYRGGENILFEAGFDFILQNNAPGSSGATTTVNLSFAQLNYVMNDYVTFAAGNLLLPLGTYSERSAGWLNKFPDNPLARSLLTGNGVGAELRGAISLDDEGKQLNYTIFGVNGPSSSDGTGNAGSLDLGGNVGLRSDNAVANLHGDPAGGARLGVFLPYKPHYDLELGISGESSQWDDAGNHVWTAGVFDASIHLGPNFEAKGEFIKSRYGSDDLGLVSTQGWWTQVGYKLAGLNLELPGINNLELMGRYDSVHDGLGTRTERYTVGGIYYLTNTLLLEGDYEFIHSNDSTQPVNQFIAQLSYGF